MTDERKHAILFAATLLAARKLIEMEPDKPNMAKGFFVDRAIEDAAETHSTFSRMLLNHVVGSLSLRNATNCE